jgi:hypothetical protein
MKAHLEPIAPAKDSSLYSRHIAEARFDHPLHYHPEIEITAITRSSGTCVMGDYVGSFEAGDCFLIGRDLQHLFSNTLKPSDGAEAEVLQFKRDFSHGFMESEDSITEIAFGCGSPEAWLWSCRRCGVPDFAGLDRGCAFRVSVGR